MHGCNVCMVNREIDLVEKKNHSKASLNSSH